MRRTLLVLAGCALLAALSAASPFRAFLAFAADTCGPDEHQYVFDGEVKDTTVKPVGTDNIRDAKRPGVKAALEQGLSAIGGDPSDRNEAGAIRDTVQKVFKGDYDAVTHATTVFSFSAARHEADNHVSTLTVSWKTKVVIVLPAAAEGDSDAAKQLTSHEMGHLKIEELLKDLAKERFGAVTGGILGQVKTDAEISALLVPIKQKLDKIGQDAIDGYDFATNHGTDGGVDQIDDATNAFNAAAAANP